MSIATSRNNLKRHVFRLGDVSGVRESQMTSALLAAGATVSQSPRLGDACKSQSSSEQELMRQAELAAALDTDTSSDEDEHGVIHSIGGKRELIDENQAREDHQRQRRHQDTMERERLRAFADHVRRSQANHELADRESLQQERDKIEEHAAAIELARFASAIRSITYTAPNSESNPITGETTRSSELYPLYRKALTGNPTRPVRTSTVSPLLQFVDWQSVHQPLPLTPANRISRVENNGTVTFDDTTDAADVDRTLQRILKEHNLVVEDLDSDSESDENIIAETERAATQQKHRKTILMSAASSAKQDIFPYREMSLKLPISPSFTDTTNIRSPTRVVLSPTRSTRSIRAKQTLAHPASLPLPILSTGQSFNEELWRLKQYPSILATTATKHAHMSSNALVGETSTIVTLPSSTATAEYASQAQWRLARISTQDQTNVHRAIVINSISTAAVHEVDKLELEQKLAATIGIIIKSYRTHFLQIHQGRLDKGQFSARANLIRTDADYASKLQMHLHRLAKYIRFESRQKAGGFVASVDLTKPTHAESAKHRTAVQSALAPPPSAVSSEAAVGSLATCERAQKDFAIASDLLGALNEMFQVTSVAAASPDELMSRSNLELALKPKSVDGSSARRLSSTEANTHTGTPRRSVRVPMISAATAAANISRRMSITSGTVSALPRSIAIGASQSSVTSKGTHFHPTFDYNNVGVSPTAKPGSATLILPVMRLKTQSSPSFAAADQNHAKQTRLTNSGNTTGGYSLMPTHSGAACFDSEHELDVRNIHAKDGPPMAAVSLKHILPRDDYPIPVLDQLSTNENTSKQMNFFPQYALRMCEFVTPNDKVEWECFPSRLITRLIETPVPVKGLPATLFGRVTRLLAAYSTHSDPPILLDDDFDADYKFDVRAATEIGNTLESNQTGTEWFSARFGRSSDTTSQTGNDAPKKKHRRPRRRPKAQDSDQSSSVPVMPPIGSGVATVGSRARRGSVVPETPQTRTRRLSVVAEGKTAANGAHVSSSESSSESSESDDGDVASDKLHQLISKQARKTTATATLALMSSNVAPISAESSAKLKRAQKNKISLKHVDRFVKKKEEQIILQVVEQVLVVGMQADELAQFSQVMTSSDPLLVEALTDMTKSDRTQGKFQSAVASYSVLRLQSLQKVQMMLQRVRPGMSWIELSNIMQPVAEAPLPTMDEMDRMLLDDDDPAHLDAAWYSDEEDLEDLTMEQALMLDDESAAPEAGEMLEEYDDQGNFVRRKRDTRRLARRRGEGDLQAAANARAKKYLEFQERVEQEKALRKKKEMELRDRRRVLLAKAKSGGTQVSTEIERRIDPDSDEADGDGVRKLRRRRRPKLVVQPDGIAVTGDRRRSAMSSHRLSITGQLDPTRPGLVGGEVNDLAADSDERAEKDENASDDEYTSEEYSMDEGDHASIHDNPDAAQVQADAIERKLLQDEKEARRGPPKMFIDPDFTSLDDIGLYPEREAAAKLLAEQIRDTKLLLRNMLESDLSDNGRALVESALLQLQTEVSAERQQTSLENAYQAERIVLEQRASEKQRLIDEVESRISHERDQKRLLVLQLQAILLARFNRVWEALQTSAQDKLIMLEKYTQPRYASMLPRLLMLLEHCTELVARREGVLFDLKRFESTVSDPRRLFHQNALQRFSEERRRRRCTRRLGQLSTYLLVQLQLLRGRFGQSLVFRGRDYGQKMRVDYSELIYELQEERLRAVRVRALRRPGEGRSSELVQKWLQRSAPISPLKPVTEDKQRWTTSAAVSAMGQIPNGALATGWLEGSVTEVGVSASPAMKPASMLAYQGPVIVDSSQADRVQSAIELRKFSTAPIIAQNSAHLNLNTTIARDDESVRPRTSSPLVRELELHTPSIDLDDGALVLGKHIHTHPDVPVQTPNRSVNEVVLLDRIPLFRGDGSVIWQQRVSATLFVPMTPAIQSRPTMPVAPTVVISGPGSKSGKSLRGAVLSKNPKSVLQSNRHSNALQSSDTAQKHLEFSSLVNPAKLQTVLSPPGVLAVRTGLVTPRSAVMEKHGLPEDIQLSHIGQQSSSEPQFPAASVVRDGTQLNGILPALPTSLAVYGQIHILTSSVTDIVAPEAVVNLGSHEVFNKTSGFQSVAEQRGSPVPVPSNHIISKVTTQSDQFPDLSSYSALHSDTPSHTPFSTFSVSTPSAPSSLRRDKSVVLQSGTLGDTSADDFARAFNKTASPLLAAELRVPVSDEMFNGLQLPPFDMPQMAVAPQSSKILMKTSRFRTSLLDSVTVTPQIRQCTPPPSVSIKVMSSSGVSRARASVYALSEFNSSSQRPTCNPTSSLCLPNTAPIAHIVEFALSASSLVDTCNTKILAAQPLHLIVKTQEYHPKPPPTDHHADHQKLANIGLTSPLARRLIVVSSARAISSSSTNSVVTQVKKAALITSQPAPSLLADYLNRAGERVLELPSTRTAGQPLWKISRQERLNTVQNTQAKKAAMASAQALFPAQLFESASKMTSATQVYSAKHELDAAVIHTPISDVSPCDTITALPPNFPRCIIYVKLPLPTVAVNDGTAVSKLSSSLSLSHSRRSVTPLSGTMSRSLLVPILLQSTGSIKQIAKSSTMSEEAEPPLLLDAYMLDGAANKLQQKLLTGEAIVLLWRQLSLGCSAERIHQLHDQVHMTDASAYAEPLVVDSTGSVCPLFKLMSRFLAPSSAGPRTRGSIKPGQLSTAVQSEHRVPSVAMQGTELGDEEDYSDHDEHGENGDEDYSDQDEDTDQHEDAL